MTKIFIVQFPSRFPPGEVTVWFVARGGIICCSDLADAFQMWNVFVWWNKRLIYSRYNVHDGNGWESAVVYAMEAALNAGLVKLKNHSYVR